MPQAAHKSDPVTPVAMRFGDDGLVPNNPTLPLLVYRGAIDVSGQKDPAARVERIFARNGWDDSWRNGIYSFTHFHSMIHEVLGVAAGRARVRFGGKAGEELEIEAGDVAVPRVDVEGVLGIPEGDPIAHGTALGGWRRANIGKAPVCARAS